jgi:iron complex transport system substrate-binding protein
MRNRWKIKGVVSFLVLLLVAGCRIEPDGVSEQEVLDRLRTDDLGRQVVIRKPIKRVVSLAPSLTESIFAVGAGEKLVGVTTYCNYPEAAKSIEKIGDTQTPNIERIVTLKPDIVFVSTASQLEAFMATLEQQGITVYVMDAKSIVEVIDDLRTLGGLLDTEERSAFLASALEARVNGVENASASTRVFIQISNEPLFTIGKDSFLTELVSKAGGESVTKDVPSGYPKLSKETASAMNPDVIILSDSGDNREPNLVFRNSNAMKNRRVYRINADIISRPGPRLVDALEQIAEFLRK